MCVNLCVYVSACVCTLVRILYLRVLACVCERTHGAAIVHEISVFVGSCALAPLGCVAPRAGVAVTARPLEDLGEGGVCVGV